MTWHTFYIALKEARPHLFTRSKRQLAKVLARKMYRAKYGTNNRSGDTVSRGA